MSWQDDTVVEARNQLNAARKQFSESGSEEDKKLLENSKKNLDSTYVGVEEKYIKEKVSNIQSASQSMQSGLAWATMNEMTGRTTPTSGRLKGKLLLNDVMNGRSTFLQPR